MIMSSKALKAGSEAISTGNANGPHGELQQNINAIENQLQLRSHHYILYNVSMHPLPELLTNVNISFSIER
jgi:hypothetical protein